MAEGEVALAPARPVVGVSVALASEAGVAAVALVQLAEVAELAPVAVVLG